MPFEKGNTLSTGRPKGSLNKKTIIKQSLQKLNSVGIQPLETTKEIIHSLMSNSEITIDQKIKLLQVTSSLIKYQTMSISEISNMNDVLDENDELKKENQELKDKYLVADTKDLLETLKEDSNNG